MRRRLAADLEAVVLELRRSGSPLSPAANPGEFRFSAFPPRPSCFPPLLSVFLSFAQADVRKRMSVVRRAHPDVTNEVAFVALAQSRGRSSEAAAVLHLPRAKDEAALVTMMLDVAASIDLAREAAERRRRLRQAEKQRRMAAARDPAAAADGESLHQFHHQHQHQHPRPYPHEDERRHDCCHPRHTQHPLPETNGATWPPPAIADEHGGGGGSRGELQSRRSDSAPSLLPPIEGSLTTGTPPSPGSLKAVLSTSRSLAVEVPSGFGLAPGAGRGPGGKEDSARGRGGSNITRRCAVSFGFSPVGLRILQLRLEGVVLRALSCILWLWLKPQHAPLLLWEQARFVCTHGL